MTTYELVGFARYTTSTPSFGMAIFQASGIKGHFYIQIKDDDSQTVTSMLSVGAMGDEQINFVAENISISVGDNYIHTFIVDGNSEGNDYAFHGTSEYLKDTFEKYMNNDSVGLPTRFLIAEELGNLEKARIFRKLLVEDIRNGLSPHSSATYENSVVRSRLWDMLLSAASSDDARRKITALRPRLTAIFTKNGGISVDISDIDVNSDLLVSTEYLIKQLETEFLGDQHSDDSSSNQTNEDIEERGLSDLILSLALSSPRQEERIAILLRGLILHPDAAIIAFSEYEDRARYASRSIQYLRHAVLSTDRSAQRSLELFVSDFIDYLFREMYPPRRGELLYYLAVHLGEFKYPTQAIEEIISRSAARNVFEFRDRIVARLHESPTNKLEATMHPRIEHLPLFKFSDRI